MKVVNQIILINFIIYTITYLFECNGLYLNNLLALHPLTSGNFSTHQIITHIFAHRNYTHVISNMVVLFLVGQDVERILGKKEFWKYFILSGVFSSGIYIFGSDPIIGASGAVFSVVTASILINSKNKDKLLSIRLKNLFFIFLIFSELVNLFFLTNDDIGHLAHILGVIFGTIYFFTVINKNSEVHSDN